MSAAADTVVAAAASDANSPFLSPPGQPYNPAELQRQFVSGMSARDVYALLCKRGGCKPISAVSSILPEKPGVWDVTSLDLSRTYVGHRGVVPVMELCKLLTKLSTLNLKNNYLTNKSIWHVCHVAMYHPTLNSIDIGENDISWTAGMCALELAVKNPAIHYINLAGTLIKPKVLDTIHSQLRRNSLSTGNRSRRRGPNSSNHPLTIRQRALKRFFKDIVSREGTKDNKVHKKYLAEGYKEVLRLSGKEDQINQRSPAFFESFIQRAPVEHIDWDTFMILVMIEDVPFNADAVESLRRVFSVFDSDQGGYVEMADMVDMMAAVHGHPPTAAEVQAKMHYFAADETMTMTWDEFLLMFYDHGPVVGEMSTYITSTPLKKARSMHY